MVIVVITVNIIVSKKVTISMIGISVKKKKKKNYYYFELPSY